MRINFVPPSGGTLLQLQPQAGHIGQLCLWQCECPPQKWPEVPTGFDRFYFLLNEWPIMRKPGYRGAGHKDRDTYQAVGLHRKIRWHFLETSCSKDVLQIPGSPSSHRPPQCCWSEGESLPGWFSLANNGRWSISPIKNSLNSYNIESNTLSLSCLLLLAFFHWAQYKNHFAIHSIHLIEANKI